MKQAKRRAGAAAVRFVAGESGPQFRFDDAVLARAGDCALLVDALSTEGLVPGTYEYVVWWSPGTGKERIERELEFGIVDTSSPSARVEPDVGADGI
jgi:hypothetical protein